MSQRTSSETFDGGRTWRNANEVGLSISRFRFLGSPVTVGYAAGETIYKYTTYFGDEVRNVTRIRHARVRDPRISRWMRRVPRDPKLARRSVRISPTLSHWDWEVGEKSPLHSLRVLRLSLQVEILVTALLRRRGDRKWSGSNLSFRP